MDAGREHEARVAGTPAGGAGGGGPELPVVQVEAKPAPSAAPGLVASARARVEGVVGGIEPGRLRAAVDALAGFGTRHTLSADGPARGIAAAGRWIERHLEELSRLAGSRLHATHEEFEAPASKRLPGGARIRNYLAIVPGTLPAAAKRAYYVVAHYDSRTLDPLDAASDAPGANDNASGCALVLELARVFAARPLEATLVFVLTGGEEQGLLGAEFRAASATTMRAFDIHGVFNHDIVGDPTSPAGCARPPQPDRVRVFSEGWPAGEAGDDSRRGVWALGGESDSPARQLARFVDRVAREHELGVRPHLVFRPDRLGRGGDHLPFAARGIPAVRFSEMEDKPLRQHARVLSQPLPGGGVAREGDLPEFVDERYLAGVARLQAATLVHLGMAPAAPSGVRVLPLRPDGSASLRWNRSPEPDLAGYEVVWRETTSPDWQHSLRVGRACEAVVPVNPDSVMLGVRAIDRDGFRSPEGVASFAADGA